MVVGYIMLVETVTVKLVHTVLDSTIAKWVATASKDQIRITISAQSAKYCKV